MHTKTSTRLRLLTTIERTAQCERWLARPASADTLLFLSGGFLCVDQKVTALMLIEAASCMRDRISASYAGRQGPDIGSRQSQ